jgi:hypothetical protein
MRNSRFDKNRSASVAVRNQAPDIHARGNESPNQERRERNGRSSRSRWRESETKVLEDHFFTRSPPVRTSTVHALEATSLSHLLQLSLTKHGRGTKKTNQAHKKKPSWNRIESRGPKSVLQHKHKLLLFTKLAPVLLFGIISLSLCLSLCLSVQHKCIAFLFGNHSQRGKKKKKQNQQQQQQQIAANNLLFFLLHFTKRFPEIDQKTKTKDKTDTKPK